KLLRSPWIRAMSSTAPKANSLVNSYLNWRGLPSMGRPFDKHLDTEELNALVASSSETGPEAHGVSRADIRDAERHVESCRECNVKVSKYRELVNRSSNVVISEFEAAGADCPKDVEWHEVAAGLWPELKAKQLILHAALCDHCGPLLRSATS